MKTATALRNNLAAKIDQLANWFDPDQGRIGSASYLTPQETAAVREIIHAAILRKSGDAYAARRKIVQAIIDDLDAAGWTIVPPFAKAARR